MRARVEYSFVLRFYTPETVCSHTYSRKITFSLPYDGTKRDIIRYRGGSLNTWGHIVRKDCG